jgi:tellurite methyltransferase
VTFLREDLDEYRLAGSFDLVINFNFLQRRLIPEAVKLLTPGGFFLIDTLLAPAVIPQPGTPDFYLQSGELLRLFAPFAGEILCHEECADADVPTARLMFRKH